MSLKSLGSYSMTSGRPESVRFAEISTKKIVRKVEAVGENSDDITTHIVETPSADYFNAMNLVADFAVELLGFGPRWTAAKVDAVKIIWEYNDRDEEWFYSIKVDLTKPALPGDEDIPLRVPFNKMPKVRDKDLPEDVAGYLETIYDEAWLYLRGKFDGGTQGALFETPTVTASETTVSDELPEEHYSEEDNDDEYGAEEESTSEDVFEDEREVVLA